MTDYRIIKRNLFLQGRRAKLLSRMRELAIAALFILALGIVGEMDYQDAVAIESAKATTLSAEFNN